MGGTVDSDVRAIQLRIAVAKGEIARLEANVAADERWLTDLQLGRDHA